MRIPLQKQPDLEVSEMNNTLVLRFQPEKKKKKPLVLLNCISGHPDWLLLIFSRQ